MFLMSTMSPVYRVLHLVLDLLEGLLTLRFVLKMFGANAANGFIGVLYGATDPLVAPFRGILADGTARRYVFEWSTILAIVVYAILVYLVIRLVTLLDSRSGVE
jgi:uncharacterized protein YggT (Ycf19 family)